MAPDQELTFEQLQKDGPALLNERPEGFVVGLFDGNVETFPKTVATRTVVEFLTRSDAAKRFRSLRRASVPTTPLEKVF